MRNKLTEKNINQIRILLLDKSISISSIAKQVGCSVQVIHNYAKKYYWDTTRDKLSREKLLSNKQIKERIIKLHNYFYSKSYQNKKFIFNFVEENDSVLASYIGRHKIPWIKILKISGLDPSCHIGQFSYGYNEKQKKGNGY